MQHLVVLGAGESGIGTAILAQKKGFSVFVSDKGAITDQNKKILDDFSISWEEKTHTLEKIMQADVVMKSPGIPDHVSIVVALREKGIPVISEIEFASTYTKALIVGITGSNGKTTTTMLTHHLLSKTPDMDVAMAGNIGDSFAKMVALKDVDCYVLELSSFQLDGIQKFAPHIAVLTNITPDHLDRYNHNFKDYVASKFRIVKNQTEKDYLIYDSDDPVITQWLSENKDRVLSKLIPFSLEKKPALGAYADTDSLHVSLEDQDGFSMLTDTLALDGKHNIKNAMAAAAVAKILKIGKKDIQESLQDFQGVAHRLEKVLKIQNVQYINDSKATNVNAVYYALETMTKDTVWIVGGVDKGNDYNCLLPLVREKVKAIIAIGEDTDKIKQAFYDVVPFYTSATSMTDAVQQAYKIATKGDVVLLSPACASFDWFTDYTDRGEQFKQAIRKL